jgi:hypothetical protein
MIKRAVLFLATFALIAGCGEEEGGGDGGGGDVRSALAAAAEKSKDIKTFSQTFTMESDLGGATFSFDGEGTSTADNQRGTMKGTMEVGGQTIEFEGILDGTFMYLKGEGLGAPAGKWIKTEDPPTSTMSPTEFVNFLKDADGVEEVGTEDVNGEQTTNYRGPLDLDKLAEKSGPAIIQQLKNNPEVGKLDITVDLWVREDGLPARFGLEITAPGEAEGSMKVSSDITDYDVPVNADPPPASDVIEAPGG